MSADDHDRPSRFPGRLNTQLITVIIVALGVGGGGGSILAHQNSPGLALHNEAAKEIFATKLEVSAMKGDLALIRLEVAQVSAQLAEVSDQLKEMDRRNSAHR